MASENMEILLKADKKPEAAAVLQFLDELTPAEQQEMLVFMQGVRFAKGLERRTALTAAQTV